MNAPDNLLSRDLRNLFADMNAVEAAELKQRSTQMMDQIEQRIHGERAVEVEAKKAKAAAAAPVAKSDSGGDSEELWPEEMKKGVQIGRVEMRVAGSTRRIPTKIMRDPETQELVPAKRRGAKGLVERNRDGYWAEVR